MRAIVWCVLESFTEMVKLSYKTQMHRRAFVLSSRVRVRGSGTYRPNAYLTESCTESVMRSHVSNRLAYLREFRRGCHDITCELSFGVS